MTILLFINILSQISAILTNTTDVMFFTFILNTLAYLAIGYVTEPKTILPNVSHDTNTFDPGPFSRMTRFPSPTRRKRGSSSCIYIRSKRGAWVMRKRPPRRLQRQRRIDYLWAMTAELVADDLVCSSSTTTVRAKPINDHSYDTDSFLIGIDNHASYSMTNNIKDFIGAPTKVNVWVKGIQGHSTSALKGTVQWDITDDTGQRHSIVLPNTYYIESLPFRLLSPQHFAQARQSQETSSTGTVSYTTADSVVLLWNNQQHRRTVPLNAANVAVFRSAPSYATLMAFDDAYDSTQHEPVGFATHLLPSEPPPAAPAPPVHPPPTHPTSTDTPPSTAAWSPRGERVIFSKPNQRHRRRHQL